MNKQSTASYNQFGHTIGNVSLVGAGPGDPDLLTIKALRTIQQADVIVFDNLVSKAIRELFPIDTPKIYVGKSKACHSATQDEINQILVTLSYQGKKVCRLKGGDAFVFGRGGEEMLELLSAGVDVDVVPGITAASGCTTYADIPLTHRGLTQGCTFITAHAGKELEHNWQALAQLNQTLVVYMGVSKCELVMDALIGHGLDSRTPAAFIEKGCTSEQRTLIGTLGSLSDLRDKHNVVSPALIVIGETVAVAGQVDQLRQQMLESVEPLPLTA
jgi:uroporphyrin-III C-methyltransferase